MPDFTFVVSTGFLTRARAAVLVEQPELAGQTNTQLNEAARQRVKRLIKDWVVRVESGVATNNAQNQITPPSDIDIA